ncbi:MAG: MBL fold metallo-hydrolase [Solobacterium sp.]|nr:MBL fold metallo-hydrolase [Solobacterium sp.]
MAYLAQTSNFNETLDKSANRPWEMAVEPFRVAPRIYYVGQKWVGAYLIDTEEGLILLDTTVFENVYLLLESIRKLGFDPRDIKHIFLSHGHVDHENGVRPIAEYTHAKIWMSKEDDEFRKILRADGHGEGFKYCPYDVDCYYDYSKPMQFGSVTVQPRLTPGHTPGTVSFFFTMPDENGKLLTAAMHGGVGTISMDDASLDKYNLPHSLRQRFIDDCEEMKKMHIDIALPSHPAHGNLFERIKNAQDAMDYTPMINPDEWGIFLDSRIGFVRDLETGK